MYKISAKITSERINQTGAKIISKGLYQIGGQITSEGLIESAPDHLVSYSWQSFSEKWGRRRVQLPNSKEVMKPYF
jgi:hypothetical protein